MFWQKYKDKDMDEIGVKVAISGNLFEIYPNNPSRIANNNTMAKFLKGQDVQVLGVGVDKILRKEFEMEEFIYDDTEDQYENMVYDLKVIDIDKHQY
jgi:hypothetical protein